MEFNIDCKTLADYRSRVLGYTLEKLVELAKVKVSTYKLSNVERGVKPTEKQLLILLAAYELDEKTFWELYEGSLK